MLLSRLYAKKWLLILNIDSTYNCRLDKKMFPIYLKGSRRKNSGRERERERECVCVCVCVCVCLCEFACKCVHVRYRTTLREWMRKRVLIYICVCECVRNCVNACVWERGTDKQKEQKWECVYEWYIERIAKKKTYKSVCVCVWERWIASVR